MGEEALSTKHLEQISRMAAVAGLAMLCISVSYDWSYLLALDVTFSEVSTTLQEHLRSALIWAPASVTGMFIGGLLVLASLGEGRVARAATQINRILIWFVLFLALGLGVWQRSLLLAYAALAGAWLWASQKALLHEPLRVAVFGTSPGFLPLFSP